MREDLKEGLIALEGSSNGTEADTLDSAIDNAMQALPSGFPLEVFPEAIQKLIRNGNETVRYNPDYLSAAILSISATAIGNTVSLDGLYIAKPILWLAIIGRRGEGKTHPLQFAKKPIEKRDTDTYKEYQNQMGEYNQQPKDQRGDKPNYSKFILQDFTPEKLAEALQFNEKGVLIHQDELMGWINSFDRYNKSGEQERYNKLWNGHELTVDRKTSEPIRVEVTNVNILGGMQPEILKWLAKNNRKDDGFLDRFLFVYPDNLDPIHETKKKIDPELAKNYAHLISNLLDTPPRIIKAEESAKDLYLNWQHKKVDECHNDNLEKAMQAKLQTYVWRLALVLDMMNQASTGKWSSTLKDKSVEDAITLVEYFRYNALKVHDRILVKTPLQDLTALQKDVYDNLPQTFERKAVLPLFKAKGMKPRTGDSLLANRDLFFTHRTLKELKYGHYKKKE